MNDEAIKRLEALIAAGQPIEGADQPVKLCPPGCTIESLEPYQERPCRMRAVIRTNRPQQFCDYITDTIEVHGDTGIAVFIHPDGAGARAIMDFGTKSQPGWGDHRVDLAMEQTPEFRALEAVCNGPLSQRNLINYLSDWADCAGGFSTVDGVNDFSIEDALKRLRRVNIDKLSKKAFEEGDLNRSRSALEEIEAKADNLEIPNHFFLTAPIYVSQDANAIPVRITLADREENGHPSFNLRITGRSRLMDEAARELERFLKDNLGAARTYIASLASVQFQPAR